MNVAPLMEKSEEAAQLLAAMANSNRLLILCNLVGGELPVGELAERVKLSQSAMSQHLAKLRALNLVNTRRDAQTIYYAISADSVHTMLSTLDQVYFGGDESNRKSAA